jgi:choline dehydrogenase-like flavoprotein
VITDLADGVEEHRDVQADVAIIGAGVAGILLAVRLRRLGLRVMILESGGREQAEAVHPLNRVVQVGDAYDGATRGRFRCLGGTSTRWGGALIPFANSDLLARDHLGLPGFPIKVPEIDRYVPILEEYFGVDGGSYEEEFVREIGAERFVPTGDPDFRARFAKWPTFKKRNVAALFGDLIKNDDGLHISLNSTAVKFGVDRTNGRFTSITAKHQSGRSIIVTAQHFVFCAGAIETTRLLLLLDQQEDQRIFLQSESLGRYFYDHVSIAMASIKPRDATRLNRLAGFRFAPSTMRSLRYEMTADAQQRAGVTNAFGHISFKTDKPSGFDALRELMRSRQRASGIPLAEVASVLHALPYLLQLGLWRVAYRQLLWPRPANYDLHVVAEQIPRRSNRITLAKETDIFGLPLAAIDWRVEDADLKTFIAYKRLFSRFWERQGLISVASLSWINDVDLRNTDRAGRADVFHPGGSTRMGTDRRTAVVDPELRIFGFCNLWTASTAVFPSGGGANPTMTLILFTLRLADRIAKEFR